MNQTFAIRIDVPGGILEHHYDYLTGPKGVAEIEATLQPIFGRRVTVTMDDVHESP